MAAKLISIKEKKLIHKFICKYQIINTFKMKLYFIIEASNTNYGKTIY